MKFKKNSILKKIKLCTILLFLISMVIFSFSLITNINFSSNDQVLKNSLKDELSTNFFYHQSSLTCNLSEFTYNYSENITIFVNYTDLYSKRQVNDAIVNCSINDHYVSSLNLVGNGLYKVILNSTSPTYEYLIAGSNSIKIRASADTVEGKTLLLKIEVSSTPTTLNVYGTPININEGNIFNVTFSYNNSLVIDQRIGNASVNAAINNSNDLIKIGNAEPLLNNSVYHFYNLSDGSYNLEFNFTYGAKVMLNLSTTFNKTGFMTNTVYAQINLNVNSTNVTFSTSVFQVSWGSNFTVNITYWDEDENTKINDANITIAFDNSDLDASIVQNEPGVYNVTINTAGKIAGNRTLKIYSSKIGYQTNYTLIILRIIATANEISTPNSSINLFNMSVNSTMQNFRAYFTDFATGNPIRNASAQFFLSDQNLSELSIESHYFQSFNDSNGNYWFNFNSTGLNVGIYYIVFTLEQHNTTHAWERNLTLFNISINAFNSYINVSTEIFLPSEYINWYQYELMPIFVNFSANSSNSNINVTWGVVSYELRNSTFSLLQSGSLEHLDGCFYYTQINLSLSITNPLGTLFYLNINTTATNIEDRSISTNLSISAKRNGSISITAMNWHLDQSIGLLIEGELMSFQFSIIDNESKMAIDGETLICKMIVVFTSGFQFEYVEEVDIKNGWSAFAYRIPYNILSLQFSFQIKRSLQMWESDVYQLSVPFYPVTIYPLVFLGQTWYIYVIIGVVLYVGYRYKFKYKPEKEKKEGFRDTISYRFKSAANLIHIMVYDQKTSEFLYAYSIPSVELSSYTMNSVLESISMYDNMKVANQEIYLRDEARLIMHDGEYTRVVMITKELPSVEMRKQMEQFMEGFELKFGKSIPEWRKDLSRLARMIDMKFADDLVEECFEVSLTFQHTTRSVPSEPIKLTVLEEKLIEIAKQIEKKSGPFLLQRLIGRAQLEIGERFKLLLIMEATYNLRKKGYLKWLTAQDAERVREQVYRETEKKAESEGKKFKKQQKDDKWKPFTN